MPRPSIDRISRFALVTADIDSAIAMFEAFDFKLIGQRDLPHAYAELLGVPRNRITEAALRLGDQEIALLAFDPPGRPYPAGSTSTDLWFQHFAIVVSDMDKAYARLRDFGRFQPISENGPETLPPSSGSVSAFKFRDGENHPLEFLAFPAEGGPDYWQAKRANGLFLGLDHSAVAIADTDRSATFLARAFGLSLGPYSENKGAEQSRMDAVPDARVTVTALLPRLAPPHIELLAYHGGRRRSIDSVTEAHDVAATFFVLETPDLVPVAEALTEAGARFVSPGIVTLEDGVSALLVLDPDGHRFCVVQRT